MGGNTRPKGRCTGDKGQEGLGGRGQPEGRVVLSGEACGLGGRGDERPGPRQARSRAPQLGRPLPLVTRSPSAGRTQSSACPASPPPGFQPFRSAPTSGARPAAAAPVPALAGAGLPSPSPGGYRRAGEGRAERTEGLRGRRARAPSARSPRGGSLQAGKTDVHRSAPTRRSPAPNQLDWPSVKSVPPPAKSHWTLRKWRVVRSPRGRSFLQEGMARRRLVAAGVLYAPPASGTRPSEPDRTRQRGRRTSSWP